MVELLVASTIFLLVLSAVLGVMVSSRRVQTRAAEQSLRIQETEAVVYLINYEVGLAGYTRTQNPTNFSDPSGETITVVLGGGGSDRIRIRFFEDPDFLAASDTGERLVEYRVDVDSSTLIREDLLSGETQALVGGVADLRVVEFIGRNREVLSEDVLESGSAEIAGVRVAVDFDDGTEWTFLVGLYNRQRVSITGAAG